jgi:hypothetical protein
MNRLRQILTVFLVGLTFFVMQAFGYGALQAQAEETVESPLGVYYKGTPSEETRSGTSGIQNDNKLVENARRNLKENADNVRSNLNQRVDNTRESLSSGNNVESPLGIYYKGTPSNTSNNQNDNNLVERATKTLKDAASNLQGALPENAVTTPEGKYYKATPDIDNQINNDNNNILEQARASLKETAENVREKLNLDEPLPRSTKEFLRSTEERVEETVEPITGIDKGYYQVR